MYIKLLGYDEAKELYGSFSEIFVDDGDLPENIPDGWANLIIGILLEVRELNKKTDDIVIRVEVLDADLDVQVFSGEDKPELHQIIYRSILASRTTCMRCSGSSWVRIRPVEGKFRRLCEGCWHMLLKPASDEPAGEPKKPTKTGTWLDEY